MDKVALARINSLPSHTMQANVPQSEEAVFVLTSSQISALITAAVEKAIQPLQDEVSQLRATVAAQSEKIVALETIEGQDISRLALDIAYDRQRISRLEKPIKEPGKTEISRAEKIERYLSSRPNHRATFETLKGHLGIDNDLLNTAIKILMTGKPGHFTVTKAPGDKRKRILIMLPR